MAAIRRKLKGSDDGDRQIVQILTCMRDDGLQAVEAACREALDHGVHSAPVIINILKTPPATVSADPNYAALYPRTRGRPRPPPQPRENNPTRNAPPGIVLGPMPDTGSPLT
jgi:hypothetical protein